MSIYVIFSCLFAVCAIYALLEWWSDHRAKRQWAREEARRICALGTMSYHNAEAARLRAWELSLAARTPQDMPRAQWDAQKPQDAR